MGLLDKVKGILFDEEEVEIPEIKKETHKEVKKVNVVEENPIKEIKIPKDDFSDKDNYKSESTFTFPIDFDDEEDEEPVNIVREKPKPRTEVVRETRKNETRDYSDFLSKKEEKKKFKPTPIISPVYGVLDQNYKKEDVIVKKNILRKPNELTIEEVRKRAFGSLEDELEQNLTTESDNVVKIKEKLEAKRETIIEPKKDVVVEKPVDKKKTIGELIEEDSIKLDIPEEVSIINDNDEYNNNVDEIVEPKNSIDDLLEREEDSVKKEEIVKENDKDEIDDDEADLFSLIDSMYEEKGE